MTLAHYTTDHARRSLLHFLLGKGVSAAAGITVLLVLIRIMTTADFGYYVAAIAFLEIFYLASGFGLSTIAQRYVAEFRVKAGNSDFKHFVRAILARRTLYAVAASAVVALAAGLWQMADFALPLVAMQPAFYGILLFGSVTRYFDEIFPALLLQGHSQSLVLLSHSIRLIGLFGCQLNGLVVGVNEILVIELIAGMSCSISAWVMLSRYLVNNASVAEPSEAHHNPLMKGVARRFYIVQLFGQVYGPNSGKLVVAEYLGLAATGAYGFIQSLTDMLRHYLPAYLLANWARPLMISRYLARRELHEVNAMASVMLKLSLLCIVPAGAFSLAGGDIFLSWISGGKVTEGAVILTAFCCLMALQSLHVVIGMITITVEQANACVIATLAACVALPTSIAGAWLFGSTGVVVGMMLHAYPVGAGRGASVGFGYVRTPSFRRVVGQLGTRRALPRRANLWQPDRHAASQNHQVLSPGRKRARPSLAAAGFRPGRHILTDPRH
jgi:O-antigen/teichoic acid export membrane protein